MKYYGLKAVTLISMMIFISSCGSTGNVAQEPETASNAVTQKQEEVAGAIADEINKVSPQPESESASEEQEAEERANKEKEPVSENKATSDGQAEKSLPESGESSSPIAGDFSLAAEPAPEKNEDFAPAPLEEANENSQNKTKENEILPDDNIEKVSDEDLALKSRKDDAPTTDEKNKVSEYKIFEEPEIIVHDIEPEAEAEPVVEAEPLVEEEPLKGQEPLIDQQPSPEIAEKEQEDTTAEEEPFLPPESREQELAADENLEKEEEEAAVAEIEPISVLAESPSEENASEEAKTESQEEEVISEEKAEQIIPSRQSTVQIGQYLDITYPGTGWVYIGENDSSTIFNYFGRKIGSEDTTFALRAKKAGQTVLHFYKNDALTGEFIEDYLEVQVLDEKGNGRVKAPSYAEIVPPASQRRLERENQLAADAGKEAEQTVSVETNDAVVSLPAAEEIALAQEADEAKEEEDAQKDENEQTAAENTPTPKNVPADRSSGLNISESNADSESPSFSNDKRQAEYQEEKKGKVSEIPGLQGSAPSQSPVTPPQQNNLKTVIQETDSTTHINDLALNKQAAKAKSPEGKRESFNYTPLSSESAQPQPEIEDEPSVSQKNKVIVNTATDDSLLEQALKDFSDKKYADALAEAQEYYNTGTKRLDEALFLLGQISESNSTVKDIRFAVDSYDMLVKRFPQSKLWKEAKNRSIYLKRFYIDIR